MPRIQIKLASAEGRTFALHQLVQARGDGEIKTVGRIVGFVRSVNGDLIIAKIRICGTRTIVRCILQDIEESLP